MTTVGIIAEFNPFHRGHEYMIRRAKDLTGADYALVVMSGHFVQRGEPALADKYLRSRMALLNGADVVVELPVRYATSSAGDFAQGAVRLLVEMGCIDYLAFGSESGDIAGIQYMADIFYREPEDFIREQTRLLKEGHSYPKARALAASSYLQNQNASEDGAVGRCLMDRAQCEEGNLRPGRESLKGLLQGSNNLLGIEYCRALMQEEARLRDIDRQEARLSEPDQQEPQLKEPDRRGKRKLPKPVTIMREGAAYADPELKEEGFSSATAIREVLLGSRRGAHELPLGSRMSRVSGQPEDSQLAGGSGQPEGSLLTSLGGQLEKSLPPSAADLIREGFNRDLPMGPESLRDIIYYRLNTISRADLLDIYGMPEGLADRLLKFRERPLGFTELVEEAKTKNITYSAVSRALIHLALNLKKEDSGAESCLLDKLTYARLLGFRKEASSLIRQIADGGCLEVITKLADADRDNPLLREDIFAGELYRQLVYSAFGHKAAGEYEHGPVIL